MTVCGIQHADGVCVMGKCPHFKRCCPVAWDKSNSKPMTNEEWFDGLNTKEKAKFFDKIKNDCCELCDYDQRKLCQTICIDCPYENAYKWEQWLKQPHKEEKQNEP